MAVPPLEIFSTSSVMSNHFVWQFIDSAFSICFFKLYFRLSPTDSPHIVTGASMIARSEDEEDCAAPCDFYIDRREEITTPVAEPIVAARAEEEEECAAPCDFYIDRREEIATPIAEPIVVARAEEEEECAAPCDFYID